MNELFPGKKRFTRKNERGEIVAQWVEPHLNWKARVVCKQCNNTWMSQIEAKHAKPAMVGLIRGDMDMPVTPSIARSLALFAFKTAVVFDHIQRNRSPFFVRSSRYRFARSLAIPFGVSMWMAGFLPMGKGEVQTCYHEGDLSASNHLRLYVCTYAVGHFAFQVVASRQQGFVSLRPAPGFEFVAVPFWPRLHDGVVWPLSDVLRTVGEFDAFSERWNSIGIRN